MNDMEFRLAIEKLLVDADYWGNYDWLNNATANSIMVEQLKAKIEKHPFIWKLFFKLA